MNDSAAEGKQPDEQNLFHPDSVVTPEKVAVGVQQDASRPVVAAAAPQEAITSSGNELPAGSEGYDDEQIAWTASEFVAHHKSVGWYALLALGAVVLAAAVWLLTRDKFSVGVVVVGAILLGAYASHKPRQLSYALDNYGLTVGSRHFSFSEFRSFSVISEGAFSSIEFMPLKRFAMFTTIYYDPKDEDRILGLLSEHLPLEDRGQDAIDRLMHHIRF